MGGSQDKDIICVNIESLIGIHQKLKLLRWSLKKAKGCLVKEAQKFKFLRLSASTHTIINYLIAGSLIHKFATF